MKSILIALAILLSNSAFSQVSLEWIRSYNGTANNSDEGWRIATDRSGNVYVSGTCKNVNTDFDYVTIKYNGSGLQQWIRLYNGPANGQDIVRSMEADKNGNVYVTGESDSLPSLKDYLTIKYDSNGTEQWKVRYNGGVNVYEAGYAITYDDSGNVYVSGESATIKYNKHGIQQWVIVHNGVNTPIRTNAIKVDKSRNVYITGGGGSVDYITAKFNFLGALLWSKQYGQGNGGGYPLSLDLDSLNNVYITGLSNAGDSTGVDYTTIKYNSIGQQQWVAKYNGYINNEDYAQKIKVFKSKWLYVTGYSKGADNSYDIATVKYNLSGVQQWATRYSGVGNYTDWANDLDLDSVGNVYITGHSSGSYFVTIKYDSSGQQKWIQAYENSYGYGISISLDVFGNVIVTGASNSILTGHDILTIKYSQRPQIRLNLTTLFEGKYYPLFNQLASNDSVTVYLRKKNAPFNIQDSATGIIDSLTFSRQFSFFNAPTDTYYVVVKHKQCIETWSKTGGQFYVNDGTINNYNFTTSASQAFGNNQKLKGSKYCLYSGDVDQSQYIDVSDFILIYNDQINFVTGNVVTDLNGDDIVDVSDLVTAHANRFIGSITPLGQLDLAIKNTYIFR